MGSTSDWAVMSAAARQLRSLEVAFDAQVLSAHRTPHDMVAFGSAAAAEGVEVIIAGAGGAAHLPGMLAATTTLPVIGVPVASSRLGGVDALVSIAQMPRGVPVATVAVDGAANAALLAARILALRDGELRRRLEAAQQEAAARARASTAELVL
jgi:5-(carboxyamino)imidazole ribonucleotide mutase